MSWAKRKDANHNEIAETFEALGWLTFDTSMVPKWVDMTVQGKYPWSHTIETLLIEVKDGSKPPSKRKLTDDQIPLHQKWNIHIIESVKDVYDLLEVTYQD